MGRGTKCDEGFVFFTRLPFIACPSLLRPRNQARPDSCCRYTVDERVITHSSMCPPSFSELLLCGGSPQTEGESVLD
ncbi:hypothetical protein EYF80_028745 [Liparis tanakae]|uniref:Uncharacterized protein n=1 Tax=Liparis tanakae TaxID=230148 RepID=A0A4Z2H8J4_9TELE|nr:hypothetical protein EYF80_028745 [Liparis tanakae]